MAVSIPIITDFNGKGIAKAKREFASLSTNGQKAGYLIKKAFVPSTAAIVAMGAAIAKAVDAALEDQKAQMELARIMRRTIDANQGQINSAEEWIDTQGRVLGITDDELRPALAKVLRVTKDLPKAFKVLALAQDIARGTGKDLGSTTDALAKALGGNMKSLKALAPELNDVIKKGASVDEVFKKLGDTFGGAASEYANTAAGRMEILKLRFSELFEQLGYAFLPAFEKLMPYFEDLANWLERNPDKVRDFADALGQTASFAANVVTSIDNMLGGLKRGFGTFLNWLIDALNFAIDQIDIAAGPFLNYGQVKHVSFAGPLWKGEQTPGQSPFGLMAASAIGGSTARAQGRYLPPGVQGPVIRNTPTNVTVNVNGGDPKAVVDAIVRWSRQNGPLPPQIQTAG